MMSSSTDQKPEAGRRMPQSELRLIKRYAEFLPKERLDSLPRGLRGIYVLYQRRTVHGKAQDALRGRGRTVR
jgi:hypothetical protein